MPNPHRCEASYTAARKEWEAYLSPKEPHAGKSNMSVEHPCNSNYWSTADEVSRLRILADVDPMQLLAAYNGTCLRVNWGNMDGLSIREEALRLAKKTLREGLYVRQSFPEEWPWVIRLMGDLKSGK